MAKSESTFLNMVLTLLGVTFIAAAILGFVHDITKDAIEASKLKAQSEAIERVLPEFDELGESFQVAVSSSDDSLEFFPAFKGGEWVGVAVKTFTNKGFGGFISVMAGIDKSGSLSGYEVLEHAETPGLGSKMDAWFRNAEKPNQNVIGKNPQSYKFEVSKDGGDIDAITASTITSRAFLDALSRAFEAFQKQEQQLENKKSSL
ncbi:MAG: RnfABCDGE type electron transport complex subunit G [Mariniphaga sp.]|nr:RnfABCDGE type electron transport complex subunit G [Mariniphaga sp.]MDD4425344.1 RnfABCDGE type electron transport complex subunit G [Mariniphaga sp.]